MVIFLSSLFLPNSTGTKSSHLFFSNYLCESMCIHLSVYLPIVYTLSLVSIDLWILILFNLLSFISVLIYFILKLSQIFPIATPFNYAIFSMPLLSCAYLLIYYYYYYTYLLSVKCFNLNFQSYDKTRQFSKKSSFLPVGNHIYKSRFRFIYCYQDIITPCPIHLTELKYLNLCVCMCVYTHSIYIQLPPTLTHPLGFS